MKWRGRRTSRNIEDRRGQSGGMFRRGGGLRSGMGGRRSGGIKIGGLGAVAILVIGLLLGVDPAFLLGGGGIGGGGGGSGFQLPQSQAPGGPNAIDDQAEEFVAVVLADTEEVWAEIFRRSDLTYEPPKLVLFSGATQSGCGFASAQSGPFYCPADRKAYLDTEFFKVMAQQLGAKGDFAAAYVIAHEVAHHVQNSLGVLGRVQQMKRQVSETEANTLSVRVELQADCYSGVWARAAQERFGSLEPGDIDEALNAASQIGDDTLQRKAGRTVVPDSFTHGSAAQRVRWFRRGFDSGDPGQCDTFAASRL